MTGCFWCVSMKTLKNLCFAFTASSGLALSGGAHAQDGIQPEDCTTFLTSGEASFYGEEVAIGRDQNGNLIYNPTAHNQEVFDPEGMTAAFRNRAYFGDYFRVVSGDESVIVRINDYGPFAKDDNGDYRVIDLTRGAAEELDIINQGHAEVSIYVCRPPAERFASIS